MKQVITGLVLGLFALQALAHPFEGNWYFVEGDYTKPDGTLLTANNATLVAVKSVKGEIFSLTNTEKGVFLGYLAGEFIVEGDYYTEAIKEGTRQEHHGKNYRFKGWLEERQEQGKTVTYWHHKGEVNGTKEREVWRKLE